MKYSEILVSKVRYNWTFEQISQLFTLPFNDLVFAAQSVHRQNFDPNTVQLSTLLSIKTGRCPEDCAYCPQSGHFDTDIEKERLLAVNEVVEKATQAKANGATRFCMGAAWRNPNEKDMYIATEMVKAVKDLGMETCMTLGMLETQQAQQLANAGLDYYNHNIDTSPEYYDKIITTRTFQDRLDTLDNVRKAGMKVCCGGILGLGETRDDRVNMLKTLANLEPHPESVPINQLVAVKGTPLESMEDFDSIEFIRTIAVARIMMPESHVRLSAGRETMSDEMQALCFHAGANSIFYGEKLLTTGNPVNNHDEQLFKTLGIQPQVNHSQEDSEAQSCHSKPSESVCGPVS